MVSILVTLLGGAETLAGAVLSNSRAYAVIEMKIDELTKSVERHNCLVKRTYRLEQDMAMSHRDAESLDARAG